MRRGHTDASVSRAVAVKSGVSLSRASIVPELRTRYLPTSDA